MPLSYKKFLSLSSLDPLFAKQKLVDAVKAGDVTFPCGTTEQSLLPWLWHSELFFLECETGSPDTAELVKRYGVYRHDLSEDIPSLTGFPLNSVLWLLERVAQGEHPRFNARVFEMLSELIDPMFCPYDLDILFFDSPQ
jgi:hypothetical protein